MKIVILSLITGAVFAQPAVSISSPLEEGRLRFNARCAGCHGQDGLGGERAPTIGRGGRFRSEDEAGLRDLIRQGLPDAGMPAFNVSSTELEQLATFVQSRVLPLAKTNVGGDAANGKMLFFGKARCAECHMVWGSGSVNGPDLTEAAQRLTLADIETSLRNPNARHVEGYHMATVHLVKGYERALRLAALLTMHA